MSINLREIRCFMGAAIKLEKFLETLRPVIYQQLMKSARFIKSCPAKYFTDTLFHNCSSTFELLAKSSALSC